MFRFFAIAVVTLAALALTACGAEPETSSAADSGVVASAAVRPDSFAALVNNEIFEPQLVLEADGTLLLIWRQKGADGFDLFSSHRSADGSFSEPERINDEPGTVYAYPHDEMRPGIATGPDGLLAVVWTDERAQIRAATSRDHGAAWSPSTQLDQTDTPAYRSFTAAAIDAAGALHAIWIDSRFAPQAGAEEPADLFYARLLDGEVTEVNLTADQDASICGCCRPDLQILPSGDVRAVFRNTTTDGYRDIFTLSGSVDDSFSEPNRVGAPTWELQGCPMSGPIAIDDQVMWRDADTGRWVVKMGGADGSQMMPVFPVEPTEWKPSAAPRQIAGQSATVLLPGQPTSRLIERRGETWVVGREDLPVWATSAAAIGDQLLVVGAMQGELYTEVLGTS